MADRPGQIQQNWLDRAIGWISPKLLCARLAWRSSLSAYDSGAWSRENAGWWSVNRMASQIDRQYREQIRARARDLERNSDIQEGMVQAFERNVVGTGFRLQPKALDAKGEIDENLNQAISSLWAEFCRPRNCDIQGRQSLDELCRMAIRRIKVDGAVFFVKAYNAIGPVPLTLQIREVDELNFVMQAEPLANGNFVVDGVEVDPYGRHMAYNFRTFTPDGYMSVYSTRIPADRVIYLQRITRPTQVREMSCLTPTLGRIRDINEYVESISVQARIAACLAIFIKKITPNLPGLGRGIAGNKIDPASGYDGQTLTPGMITTLQPGEDASVVQPPNVGASAKELIAIQQRMAGAGQGLSYEAASRDLSQVNYSSARQGLLEDIRQYKIDQNYLITHLLDEVYGAFLISAALKGALPITIEQLLGDKARYMAHRFVGCGWSWIDPLKEANANATALMTGQDTLESICAEQGLDWQDVVAQRGREVTALKAVGLGGITDEQTAANAAAAWK